MLHGAVPAGVAAERVAGAVLVRVLPVAQHLGPGSEDIERGRQLGVLVVAPEGGGRPGHAGADGGPCLCPGSGVAGAVHSGVSAGVTVTVGAGVGVEPRHDRPVVGGGVGEGVASQTAARLQAGSTVARGAHLRQGGLIVGGFHEHRHVVVVLGRRAHHRRAPDVDQLDRRVGGERVQVHRHQVDRRDAVGRHVLLVGWVVTVREDAPVDGRVEGDHPVAEHLGEPGDRLGGDHGEAGLGEHLGGAAGRHQLPTLLHQCAAELDHAGLVEGRQQRSARGCVTHR